MGVGIRFDFNQERQCPAFDPCKCVGELVRPGHVNRVTPARASNGAVIDLSEVTGVTAADVSYNATAHQVQIDTNHDGTYDMFINVAGSVAPGDYIFS